MQVKTNKVLLALDSFSNGKKNQHATATEYWIMRYCWNKNKAETFGRKYLCDIGNFGFKKLLISNFVLLLLLFFRPIQIHYFSNKTKRSLNFVYVRLYICARVHLNRSKWECDRWLFMHVYQQKQNTRQLYELTHALKNGKRILDWIWPMFVQFSVIRICAFFSAAFQQ